jgi:hypothetical protein
MPTHAYRCEQCGESFEQVETIFEHGTLRPAASEVRQRTGGERPTAFVATTAKKS